MLVAAPTLHLARAMGSKPSLCHGNPRAQFCLHIKVVESQVRTRLMSHGIVFPPGRLPPPSHARPAWRGRFGVHTHSAYGEQLLSLPLRDREGPRGSSLCQDSYC